MYRILLIIAIVLGSAVSVSAQTQITVTPSTTYQTWRTFGGNMPPSHMDDNMCTTVSSAQFSQAVAAMDDEGVNDNRLEMKPVQNIESSDGAGFVYTNMWHKSPSRGNCPTKAADDFTDAQNWRTQAIADGVTPQTTMTFITFNTRNACARPTTGSNCFPNWWLNGERADSGPVEATEAYQGTIDYIRGNYGFCPTYVKWNEPDGNGVYGAFGGAASWLPGLVNQFTKTMASDPLCPSVKFVGPEDVNGNDVLTDLYTYYGAVAGSEANLALITWHAYTVPSDKGAAIWTHANGEGKEVAMTEFYCGGDKSYTQGMNCFLTDMLPLVKQGNISGWEFNASWNPCYTETVQGSCNNIGGGDIGIGWGKAASKGANSPGFFLEPTYYVYRQFFKYGAVPGNVRVSATSSNDSAVTAIAWKRSDNSLVVTVWNVSGSAQGFSISGLPNVQFHIHKLDPTMCDTSIGLTEGVARRCTPTDNTVVTPIGGIVNGSLPTQGIWTYTQDPPPPISVTVAPVLSNVSVNATTQFTAALTNDLTNAGVTWALSGSGSLGATRGTLVPARSLSGVAVTYAAPAPEPSPNTITITATSVADVTKSASATITVIQATSNDPLN